MFCEEEKRQLQNFYFWYLAEQYFEAQSIERMQRSVGFCRRHTARLLALGPSSTIARVYLWMVPPYLKRLRELEVAPFGRSQHGVGRLRPSAECSACLAEREAVRSAQLKLASAVESSSAICLAHFRHVAGSLGWAQLRSAAQALVGELGGHEPPPLARLKGIDLDASPRWRAQEAAAESPVQWMAGAGLGDEGPWQQAWSPTLEALRQLLRRPTCPACESRQRALHEYFGWLEQEISMQPRSRWEDAVWLCRQHAWDFAASRDAAAVDRLNEVTASYWHGQLGRLSAALARQPSANPLARIGAWHSPRQLGAAVASALRPPASVLAELRERLLRPRECPACRAADTASRRMAELVAVGMGDAETRTVYERSAGLCYRHLPLACEAARDQHQLRTLAATQRVRLEILHWELDEALRKESWSVRYEERRGEASAWRRAVAQVSGSGLTV